MVQFVFVLLWLAIHTVESEKYNCSFGSNFSSPHEWTPAKQMWCYNEAVHQCKLPTTTSLGFDCSAGYESWETSWTSEKKKWCCQNNGRSCPGAKMSCDLFCFGEGAPHVNLPGGGGVVFDKSPEECRELCLSTEGCQAIVYETNASRPTCQGKSFVHTDKCQPGGGHITEVLRGQPWGKCAFFGDPHIITFDRVYGPVNTDIKPGEFYAVKSAELNIHVRYGFTHRFPHGSSTVGLAVAGAMIDGHTLVVEYVGPERGVEGFQVHWDGDLILTDYPSNFRSKDGVLAATFDAMDPWDYHREGRHTIGGTNGTLPSYYFQLRPFLNIYVLIGPDNCNAVIEMKKLTHPMDGFCGNFDCDQENDGLKSITERGMAQPIPSNESLFTTALKMPMNSTVIKKCSPELRKKAAHACQAMPPAEIEACVSDVCSAESTDVVATDMIVNGMSVSSYNCTNLNAKWSPQKHEWCCASYGLGCTTTLVTTTASPFDCVVAASNPRATWSYTQKLWCCQYECHGCEKMSTTLISTSTTTTLPFNCDEGYRNWMLGWSDGKKDWCCKHEGKGCTTTLPYNCNVGFAHWNQRMLWSTEKSNWCCSNSGKGCPTLTSTHTATTSTTTTLPYDCDAGYRNWMLGWSDGKKKWCCKHEGKGCTTISSTLTITTTFIRKLARKATSATAANFTVFDFTQTTSLAQAHTSQRAMRAMLVQHQTSITTTTTCPWACDVGFHNWYKGWSDAKKEYCCKHEQKGCPTTTTEWTWTCSEGLVGWQTGWSTAKKEYCCKHTGKGCESTTTSCPWECHAGLAGWQSGWSEVKKAWCCKHRGLGCTESTATPRWACQEGLENWQVVWSEDKMAYCCKHHQLGCITSTTAISLYAFDCGVGYAHWEIGWSIGKKAWCCKHASLGCSDELFARVDPDELFKKFDQFAVVRDSNQQSTPSKVAIAPWLPTFVSSMVALTVAALIAHRLGVFRTSSRFGAEQVALMQASFSE